MKKIKTDRRGEAGDKETTEELSKRKGKSGGRVEKFKLISNFEESGILSVRPHFKC